MNSAGSSPIRARLAITEPLSEEFVTDLGRWFEVRYAPQAWQSPAALIDAARGASILVTRNLTRLDAGVIKQLPDLRRVAVYGVGTDHVDLAAARAAAIQVISGSDENAQAVAEFTLMLILSLLRRLEEALRAVDAETWPRDELVGEELGGRRVLVVGEGKVGSRVARLLDAFGAQVLIGRRTGSLDENLAAADIVTLHLPYAPGAAPLLSRREFALMKPGALLVNTSRGGLVDQEALFEALNSGLLSGAALDVLRQEPPPRPYPKHPRLLLTPHIAGFSRAALQRLHRRVLNELLSA